MNLLQFIRTYNIRPADAIVVKKEPWRLLDHYIIYLGNYADGPNFIANYRAGTRIISDAELQLFAPEFSADRIVRFNGNEQQRNTAIQRALRQQDQTSYHLILNNCEHFSNYVQTGLPFSQQTQKLGAGLVAAGLLIAGNGKRDEIRGLGLLTAALGLFTLWYENEQGHSATQTQKT